MRRITKDESSVPYGEEEKQNEKKKPKNAPLEVKEEPPRLPNDPQLIQNRKEEENRQQNDGDQPSRLLLDVMWRKPVNREPFERDLRSYTKSPSLSARDAEGG